MNVLVVDDHAPFRARARRMLELAGHRVVGEAATPDEALEQSARLAPEVVLLDVQLGDADGLAILDALSRSSPAPRVVLLSSREAQDYGSRLDGIAAAGFIHKPDLSAGSFAAALQDPRRLRVIVADDSTLIREGIGKALAARGLEVVAEAGDGEELLRAVAADEPDAVVADIRMPPTGTDEGLRAAAALAERAPAVGVLILSDHLEPTFATRLLEQGTPGRGYLLKESIVDLDRFADAVTRVAAGESVIDPAIVHHVIGVLRASDPLAELTPREREILRLMAEGRSNAGIATELVISPRTVETHVSRLFGKLGLADRPDDHRRVLAVLAYLRS